MNLHNQAKSQSPVATVVGQNEELVRRIAWRLHRRLPASVQIEDLVQAGMVGLLEAYDRYDSDSDASFQTFAGIRIRGAMLDEIRRGDWAPRSLHRAARALKHARADVERSCGGAASGPAIAQAMGISACDYRQLCADIDRSHVASLDAVYEAHPGFDPAVDASNLPEEFAETSDLWEQIRRTMAMLPERDQQLLDLYYDRGENLREIAVRLGVSESRVCQLHGRAIQRVRDLIGAAA